MPDLFKLDGVCQSGMNARPTRKAGFSGCIENRVRREVAHPTPCNACFGVSRLIIDTDGFAVVWLLPVVAPCGEVVGGVAGEGGMLGVQLVEVLEADVGFGQLCEVAHEVVECAGIGAGLGEGEGLGEAADKGGMAGEVAQADGYGEAVGGGGGGWGEVGYGWDWRLGV